MECMFMTTEEVATFLRLKPHSLQTYGSKCPVYRPDRHGLYHVEHVKIIEKVHVGVLAPEEGFAFWELAKNQMKISIRRQFGRGAQAV